MKETFKEELRKIKEIDKTGVSIDELKNLLSQVNNIQKILHQEFEEVSAIHRRADIVKIDIEGEIYRRGIKETIYYKNPALPFDENNTSDEYYKIIGEASVDKLGFLSYKVLSVKEDSIKISNIREFEICTFWVPITEEEFAEAYKKVTEEMINKKLV